MKFKGFYVYYDYGIYMMSEANKIGKSHININNKKFNAYINQ